MDNNIEFVIAFCDEASDLLLRWESVCIEIIKKNDFKLYQELFRIAHNLKGGSRTVGLGDFGDFIHKIEDCITLLRDGTVETTAEVSSGLLEAQKIMWEWIEQLRENPMFVPENQKFLTSFTIIFSSSTQATPEGGSRVLPLPVEALEKIETPTLATQSTQSPKSTRSNRRTLEKKLSTNESIRVPAAKLDVLLQTIGELSIHQSILWHSKSESVSVSVSKMMLKSMQLSQKLTKELYSQALSLRMQPLSGFFQRLERNIIDLSKDLNKSVRVEVEGAEVELDKSVIEKIVDPLTHIVRNAIDHGIESVADRIIEGKSEQGLILIRAHQDTFGVEIRVSDDGKGLNKDVLIRKAKEKGILTENANLTDDAAFQLIFLPGFSTNEKITDVSGRGVGMDVVSKALEELNGSIRIESQVGKGTTFVILLPTSMNIIDALTVTISNQHYVVPLGSIDEVITSDDFELNPQTKMVCFRKHVLPIWDFSESFRNHSNRTEFSKSILICKHREQRIGLLVDNVGHQQQIVIRPLHENISGSFGIMGGTILGNGEPGLILDIVSIVEKITKQSQPRETSA